MTRPRRPRRTDRGAATAELAMVLPILVAVTIGLVWLLAVGAAQVRVVDAARESARAAARGEADGDAVARGQQVAPAGATVTLSRSGDRVRAVASGEVRGPGGLFGFLPGVTVRAAAVAAAEGEARTP
ncbi:TadE family type IV pilus minor pilin [Nocardioides sp. W7]|uniref:TadE family type IV pilus minor pilin n=1 Tax=Nocardioides sp. W7 TaxID=2931390 RepID=UPI001FD24A73|nr:TadE family type IV pilus minor pilin [Nocardioides sp. W7]